MFECNQPIWRFAVTVGRAGGNTIVDFIPTIVVFSRFCSEQQRYQYKRLIYCTMPVQEALMASKHDDVSMERYVRTAKQFNNQRQLKMIERLKGVLETTLPESSIERQQYNEEVLQCLRLDE